MGQVKEICIIVLQIYGSWKAYRQGVTPDSTRGGHEADCAFTTTDTGLSTILL
jgi:hypothetical protein